MEDCFSSKENCYDCRVLRISHLRSLIKFSAIGAFENITSKDVRKSNFLKMSDSLACGQRTEAWAENAKSTEPYSEKTSSSSKSCFSIIPDELLLYIFSFFNVYELCNFVAPVCTRWWKMSKDCTLWKHLRFSYECPVQGERIRELLTANPQLITLELQSREDGGDLVLHAAIYCHRLEKLTAKFCDGLDVNIIKVLVENCPQITYLNVEGSRVCSSECYLEIANFSKLKHLNLSHCHYLDNIGLVRIAKQCKYLEYIDIDGITGICDIAVVRLTCEVGHCLTHLFLDGENLTDLSYKSLDRCKKLKMLGISFCEQMTDRGLSGIYELKQLTFLKLRKGIQLTPVGLEKLFGEGRLSLLTHINLGECSLMDDRVLIAMASSCPLLTNLVLHWCWEVTDFGVSAIVDNCCHIRVLDLVGVVQLTGESFRNVTTKLPNLVILDLEQCNNVNDLILQQIVTEAKNPSLRVFDYWGDPVVPAEEPDETGS